MTDLKGSFGTTYSSLKGEPQGRQIVILTAAGGGGGEGRAWRSATGQQAAMWRDVGVGFRNSDAQRIRQFQSTLSLWLASAIRQQRKRNTYPERQLDQLDLMVSHGDRTKEQPF